MLCAEATLVKHGPGVNAARVLYCRSWQCDICRPKRRNQLIAMAIKGKAERFITLTTSDETGPNPVERCRRLIKAWRQVREEIACNMTLPSAERWQLPVSETWTAYYKAIRRARRDAALMKRHAVEFLAVVEAQDNGNPHLHIITRGDYVPQWWLSYRMKMLAAAPICDIRYVKDRRKLANYVAKYCGKNPQRFGTCKRYWQSKTWSLVPKMEKERRKLDDPVVSRSGVSIEEWSKAEHCWTKKLFWHGAWLHSVAWNDDAEWNTPCEIDGCTHDHHKN